MDTLALKCWIYGDDPFATFPVKIARTETVGSLKKVIKDENLIRFNSVDAADLVLYSIPIPDEEHFEATLKNWTCEGQTRLHTPLTLSDLTLSGNLVIVHAPNLRPSVVVSDMTLKCWVRGNTTGSVFPVEISSTKTVAALKEVIKCKKPVGFCDVDPDDLALYKVCVPCSEGDNLEDVLGARTINSLGMPLWSLQKLSVVFNPPPPDNQLHLIVDGLALSFQCWIRGAELANSFAVKISVKASVDDLKNAIKAAYGADLDHLSPDRLKLYKISVNEEAELPERLSALGSGRFLHGNELVHSISDDVPFFQRPRVVVEPGTEHPSLTGPATSRKREHSEDRFEAIRRIRRRFATLPIQTASMIATHSYFRGHYQRKDDPYVRCGRPDENQTPFPLVLAHPIFATFVSECETYEPIDEDLKLILKLFQSMHHFSGDEKDRRTQFRACMREYGISLTVAKIEGTEYMTDGDARVGALPYLISIAASEEDPCIQVAAYHLAATQSWLRAHPDDLRALPCIHIFYDGPVLGFAGSMLTEGFDVNVLGPVLPLFYHRTDIDLQIRGAKMFGALKTSAIALKEYYEDTVPQSLTDRRFPWITQYDTITPPIETLRFEYLRRMDGGSLAYICEHIHDKKRILVKFVRTYSKDAHLASAAKDGAPRLLGHCNVLSCGWSVVVMELLEEPDWVSGLEIIDEVEQRMVRDKVKEHVSMLHQRGFVHGDIRPQNVFVTRPDAGHTLSVRLVDFDWAGETNKAKYPFFVNPELGYGFRRPSGVKGGGIITMEHDLAMVDLMYLSPPWPM